MTDFIIVDDDSFNNVLCDLTIKEAFVEADVRAYEECEEALAYLRNEIVRNRRMTILLLDIEMHGMNGWEFMEQIDQMETAVKNLLKICIVSVSLIPGDQEKAFLNPLIRGFLLKPIDASMIRLVKGL